MLYQTIIILSVCNYSIKPNYYYTTCVDSSVQVNVNLIGLVVLVCLMKAYQ